MKNKAVFRRSPALRSLALVCALSLYGCGSSGNSASSSTGSSTQAAAAVTLSVSTVTFSSTPIGSSAVPQPITVVNTGGSALTITGIAFTGASASQFSDTTTCGTTLAVNAACLIEVTFAPSSTGTMSATLNIADSASGSPQTVSLSGTAVAALGLSVSSLTFTQAAESASAAQTVTVSNRSSSAIALNGIALTGTSAASFGQTNTCGASLAASATCTVSVTFTPFLATSYSASLSIASNTVGSPQTVSLSGIGTGSVSINTSGSQWVITNGAMTYNWSPTGCNVTGVLFNNSASANMVDTTTGSNGVPDGLYMDNTGTNLGSGTVTANYAFGPNNDYLDWWCTTASNSTNAFTTSQHFVTTANDTGLHIYSTVAQTPSDIAGNIGQWQYVFRIDLNKFVETYSVNAGLNNPGVLDTPLPAPAVIDTTDPGRQVQNAAVDIHGLAIPSGFLRQFYTKYDYSSYEYLHQEHGIYGSQYGAWMVIPSLESLAGGPTKQDLIFTGNIVMMEALSGHLDNSMVYAPSQGTASLRLFGPYYYHFNQFTTTNTTPASLYREAQTYLPDFNTLYDNDSTLTASGYVPSTGRGTVAPTISGGGSSTANTAWVVLSDPATNFQHSSLGRQYWTSNNAAGTAQLTGVVPGKYRLSAYVLGEWGELRQDNVVVAANQTTSLPSLTFTPENFGPSAPIWTIGAPDRSGHEFLHGEDANGHDFRNFYGAYNYWADFASTSGQQVYYATAVGSAPATNNLARINYNQWGQFDPGLYAGIYNAADDTTDGYKYILPSYVSSVTANVPATTIHFTANATQLAQGQYTVLSIGVACAEGSITATLNGHALVWHYINASDCMIRSGLSGYYQWIAMEWPTSDLNAAGADNVLTLSPSQADGFTLDALRMEIADTSSNPATTGWHDYEWVNTSTYTPANDALPSN